MLEPPGPQGEQQWHCPSCPAYGDRLLSCSNCTAPAPATSQSLHMMFFSLPSLSHCVHKQHLLRGWGPSAPRGAAHRAALTLLPQCPLAICYRGSRPVRRGCSVPLYLWAPPEAVSFTTFYRRRIRSLTAGMEPSPRAGIYCQCIQSYRHNDESSSSVVLRYHRLNPASLPCPYRSLYIYYQRSITWCDHVYLP